ncbi:hypothetical protein ACIGO9_10650 [Nocardia asteroides]
MTNGRHRGCACWSPNPIDANTALRDAPAPEHADTARRPGRILA